MGLLLMGVPAVRAVNLVQEFYLPMPEAQIYQANNSIISGTGSTIASTFSIIVTGNGTVIYYDQWEDGYETDLSNPTQPTTQIWGDGNDAHGIPPGFAHNPLGLPAGTVITLTNNVPQPRNPSTILWDARDRIAANKALIITRAGWPIPTGPVFAGAVSVLSTIDYGTNYISPVGQNLTNVNLMKYVGMFIMAAQNNTAVTIDPNGNGVGKTNIVLNQGESYLVNGGIMVGGRVTASEPIQADLIIGHVGASYASDWFTLYPVGEWSSAYYTPVSSAATVNQPAYVYLYNPGTNAITINYNTKAGSGSFSVPGTNGVFKYQMPVGSGASFVSAGGQNFYALCTVAANNSSDTPWNWGFTLVPQGALTTEADVGWAPGSSDGTVDGSPVWVTALANTKLYVDYKGDHLGPLTDPNGNQYDTNFTVTALQSQKIYDPSKNQTGMRVYTLDGTLITAAWGEDADVAGPGNPYIDAGTTVIPFPVPLLKKSAVIVTDTPPAGLSVGDIIKYTVEVDNKGLLPLGNTVVIDAPSGNLTYVTNSTTLNSNSIPDNASGQAFPLAPPGYTIPVILSQGVSTFQYLARVNAAGVVSNSVNIGGTAITVDAVVTPPPANGASVSLNFTDTNGLPVSFYTVGANVFVTMTNAAGNTSSNSVQTISVTVVDQTHGDVETIPLVETGTNTGVFRNVGGLPTSTTLGLNPQDGILNVTPGDMLSVSYTDPNFGDSATANAGILIPALTKQLYLSANGLGNGVQDLNRIDPVAYGHSPTRTSVDIGGGVSGPGAWLYRQAIIITHTNVFATDQTNFPVLINLASNTGLQNHAQASGNDILFTASDGVTVLSYEREKYTNSTGALVAWVKVPILSHTTNTVLYMYYGNSSATDQQDAHNVWDSNFKLVYHLGDAGPTTAVDSTTNSNNGTATGATFGAAGQIDGATSYSNGNTTPSNFISAASSPGIGANQSFSYEMWIKVTGTYVNQTSMTSASGSWFLDRATESPGLVGLIPVGSSQFGYETRYDDDSGLGGPTGGTVSANWTHVVMVRDYNTAFRLYVNGTQVGTTTDSGSQALTPPIPRLGRHVSFTSNTPGLNGLIDEFRISGIARSAGWIQTEYTNQVSPSTFYSVGAETANATTTATNVTTFVQTPAFSSAFTMPSNNVIVITNFITVTNGVMPANPAITATLQHNGANFITLTNPAYSAAGGYLVWSGVLTSNVTIPAGQIINYVISNGVANTAFHVNYDSTNMPSKIILPASTVINVNTLGVYDAPYPGGNLVTSPDVGSTLYIRANVSDPFGNYDITSLGLAVTGPTPASSFTNTLNDANVVTNDSVSKTYEFQWVTGLPAGGYNIAATANEGTEGITDTAGASVTLIALDLGVPSTTEFTSGNNGSDTNAFPANNSACVRVTAPDSITNANIQQTITVAVTSSTGDAEILTLIETSTNTGIYTACIPTSTTTGTTQYDGTLYAPIGSIITASYTDPNDPSFDSSATATIQPLPGVPGVVMNKTLVSPSGGQVGVGQPVTYNLQVVNTGSTVLTNVIVTDNFPSGTLSYSTASPAPSATGSGVLTWNNLGSFGPGQSTNLTVTFTTLATGTATNSATANGGTATNSSSAILFISHAALNVTKILLSPTNTPVAVGSNVVFRITIQNAGNTAINYLPLEDDFSGAYYQLVSSTITNNGSGYGLVVWTNLAYPTVLATNATITNDITMTVVGQGNPANNTATVGYATDVFGNPVPSASSTIGVVTAAAAISGNVYNDVDQSGTLTPGDLPLPGVTLSLYTDPNGDGDPSDGTLVQIAVSDGSGYYYFDNLNLGHYVVVATDLPGYSSSAPPDNHLAINITSLATSANNNFFQYVPAPSLYSTISGTVWNDVNGNGTNDVGETGVANVEIDLVQDGNSNGIADSGEPVVASVNTDTNGNYSIADVPPGYYVIREDLVYGYYTTGDSQGRTDNQISFVSTNGIVSTNNSFFDRLLPIAVNDTDSALNDVPVTIYPLTNDISPYTNDVLTITSATTSNGVVVINPGNTNLTFTPTNTGTATITYTINDGFGGTSSAVITVNVTALADVGMGKSALTVVGATSNLTYTISVTNFGPSTATGVTVTDAVPAGAAFAGASGNGAFDGVEVTWNLGDLPDGAVSNVTLTVTAPADGSLTNVAGAVSTASDPNPSNNTNPPVITSVSPVADLAVGKSGPAGALFGTNFNYTISVTNFGPSTATGVSVTDSLPAGLIFVSSVPVAMTNGNNQVIWTNLGTLVSGAVTNLTLTVNSTSRGNVSNVASLGSPALDTAPANNISLPVLTAVTNWSPAANPDNYSMAENTTNTFAPLANDVVMTPGGTLTIIGVNPTNGAATIIGGTNVQFVPNLNFTGTAYVGYTITDNVGGTNSSLITIAVTNVLTVVTGADVQVFLFGPTNATVGDGFVYTTVVTNGGPWTATNTLATNVLAANLVFDSASGGGVYSNGIVTWPVFTSLTNGQATNLTVTVSTASGVSTNLPTSNPFNFIESNATPIVGFLTNRASAFAATHDWNLTNNIASALWTNAQLQTLIVPGVFGVFIATNTYPTNGFQGIITNTIIPIGLDRYIVGTSAWNPVTQLYEEFVSVTNIGQTVVHSLRLYVSGLRSGVTLYNATGTNNGVPYVEYDPPPNSPIYNTPPYNAPSNGVTLVLEFYSANGLRFTNSLSAAANLEPTAQPVNGVQVTGVSIQIPDNRNPNQRLLIQFKSILGRTYTIEYSDDLITWHIAVPSIVASATSTLWYDDGPPETLSKPGPSRYYIVILQP
jgi:uncharacterized repeat protein (TIGR01451 family)